MDGHRELVGLELQRNNGSHGSVGQCYVEVECFGYATVNSQVLGGSSELVSKVFG